MTPPDRAPAGDLLLLAVAVAAVSTSAPLIAGADAPSLSIAFWRNALSLPILAVWVLAQRSERAGWRARSTADRHRSMLAGAFLGAHFAAWIPSLSLHVGGVVGRARGDAARLGCADRPPARRADPPEHLGGDRPRSGRHAGAHRRRPVDLRAARCSATSSRMVGGMLAAAYVTVGAEVRRHVSTVSYALVCYATAAALLLALCVTTRQALTGYDRDTWLAIGGLVLGAQLLGHTLVNLVLRSLSPTAVSVAILFEILGATRDRTDRLRRDAARGRLAGRPPDRGRSGRRRPVRPRCQRPGRPRRCAHVTQPRFVPVLDLPDDWSGAITVVVQQGQVARPRRAPRRCRPPAPTAGARHARRGGLLGDRPRRRWRPRRGARRARCPLMAPLRAGRRPRGGRWPGGPCSSSSGIAPRASAAAAASPTEPMPGERARRCPSCGLLAFPRLAPAVITLDRARRRGAARPRAGRSRCRCTAASPASSSPARRWRRRSTARCARRSAWSWPTSGTSPASRGPSRTR